MLLLSALIAIVPTPAVAAPGDPRATHPLVGSTRCPRTTNYYAFERAKTVAPRKLNELPDANAYYTVYRVVNGCESPVIVKYNVSGR